MRSSSSRRSFSTCSTDQLLDAARHQVERLGQLAELVARADPDLVAEVALPQPLGPDREGVDAPGDRPREEQAEDERHRVHHDEDETQDAEGVHQVVGDAAPAGVAGHLDGGQPPHEVPRLVLEGVRHAVEGAALAGLPVRLLRQGHEQEPGAGGGGEALPVLLDDDLRAPALARPQASPALRRRPDVHLAALEDVDAGPPLDLGEEHLVGRHLEEERLVALRPGPPQPLGRELLVGPQAHEAGEARPLPPRRQGPGGLALGRHHPSPAQQREGQAGVQLARGPEAPRAAPSPRPRLWPAGPRAPSARWCAGPRRPGRSRPSPPSTR